MSSNPLAISRGYSHTSTGTRTVSAHEQMRVLCQVTHEPRRADASVMGPVSFQEDDLSTTVESSDWQAEVRSVIAECGLLLGSGEPLTAATDASLVATICRHFKESNTRLFERIWKKRQDEVKNQYEEINMEGIAKTSHLADMLLEAEKELKRVKTQAFTQFELVAKSKGTSKNAEEVAETEDTYTSEMMMINDQYSEIAKLEKRIAKHKEQATKVAATIEGFMDIELDDNLQLTGEQETQRKQYTERSKYLEGQGANNRKEVERIKKMLGRMDGEDADAKEHNTKLNFPADLNELCLRTIKTKLKSYLGSRSHTLHAIAPAVMRVVKGYDHSTNTFRCGKALDEIPEEMRAAYEAQNKQAYYLLTAELGIDKMQQFLKVHHGGHNGEVVVKAQADDFVSVIHYICSKYGCGNIFKQSEDEREILTLCGKFHDNNCRKDALQLIELVHNAEKLYGFEARSTETTIKVTQAFLKRYHGTSGPYIGEKLGKYQDGGKSRGVDPNNCTEDFIECLEAMVGCCDFLMNADPSYAKSVKRAEKGSPDRRDKKKERATRQAKNDPTGKGGKSGKDGKTGKDGKGGKGGKAGDGKKPSSEKCQRKLKSGKQCTQKAAPANQMDKDKFGRKFDRLCVACLQEANSNRPTVVALMDGQKINFKEKTAKRVREEDETEKDQDSAEEEEEPEGTTKKIQSAKKVKKTRKAQFE